MKKEELIKRAAERGITLDETQAEKYVNLSDEELANLEISGGACGGEPPAYQLVPPEYAANCPYYEKSANPMRNSCLSCRHSYGSIFDKMTSIEQVKCTNQAAWKPA
jgi:hypothetical protein